MAGRDVESSAMAPELKKQGRDFSKWEEPMVMLGMVIGAFAGVRFAILTFNGYAFFGGLLGLILFGTLGGWLYHLCCTAPKDRGKSMKKKEHENAAVD